MSKSMKKVAKRNEEEQSIDWLLLLMLIGEWILADTQIDRRMEGRNERRCTHCHWNGLWTISNLENWYYKCTKRVFFLSVSFSIDCLPFKYNLYNDHGVCVFEMPVKAIIIVGMNRIWFQLDSSILTMVNVFWCKWWYLQRSLSRNRCSRLLPLVRQK